MVHPGSARLDAPGARSNGKVMWRSMGVIRMLIGLLKSTEHPSRILGEGSAAVLPPF